MNQDENASAILREHLNICSELHALLLEESRLLRATNSTPDEQFLGRKRTFLPRLDGSLAKLKELNENGTSFSREESELVEEGRRRLLQIMILDRENERLLLRAAVPQQTRAAYAPVVPGTVARAYGRYSKPRPDAGEASGG